MASNVVVDYVYEYVAVNLWFGEVVHKMKDSHKEYVDRFDLAVQNSEAIGLDVDDIVTNGCEVNHDVLLRACLKAFPTPVHMALNCPDSFKVNDILRAFGFNTGYITIGYIKRNDEVMFPCTVDGLKAELGSTSDSLLKMHVWITFPDGIIVDPTLFASLEKKSGRLSESRVDELPLISACGHVKGGHGIEYFPVLVGKQYLYKSGVIHDHSVETFAAGRSFALNFYEECMINNIDGSLIEVTKYCKRGDPEGYRGRVAGFEFEMKALADRGLVNAVEVGGDTIYSSVD